MDKRKDLKITKSLEDGQLSIALHGRLDTTTASELETLVQHAIKGEAQDEVQELVFDLAELEYMSSAGIRVVMGAEEAMKGRMTLTNLNEDITELFEMTGLTDVVKIE